MMTRGELDEARAHIHDICHRVGAVNEAVRDLASIAERLLGETERQRMSAGRTEQLVAHARLLGEARAALAAARAGLDPVPWLEHALAPYGGVPADAVPERLTADAAGLAEAVSAPC